MTSSPSTPPHAALLLVDDVPKTAVVTRNAICAAGLNIEAITTSHSFQEALELLRHAGPYQVVVLDLYMDGDLFAGLTLAEAAERLPEPPAIFLYSRYKDFIETYSKHRQALFQKLLLGLVERGAHEYDKPAQKMDLAAAVAGVWRTTAEPSVPSKGGAL